MLSSECKKSDEKNLAEAAPRCSVGLIASEAATMVACCKRTSAPCSQLRGGCTCRWLPGTASFVVLGCHPRGTGMLQVFELDDAELHPAAQAEQASSLKCGAFGAGSAAAHMAVGNFAGQLQLLDLEQPGSAPVFSVHAHRGIVNALDAFGSQVGACMGIAGCQQACNEEHAARICRLWLWLSGDNSEAELHECRMARVGRRPLPLLAQMAVCECGTQERQQHPPLPSYQLRARHAGTAGASAIGVRVSHMYCQSKHSPVPCNGQQRACPARHR